MGCKKIMGLEGKTTEEKFDELARKGWEFVTVRERGDNQITNYNLISPSGNSYSLCNFSNKDYREHGIINHGGGFTQFDAELEDYNARCSKRLKEGEVASEIVDLLKDITFPERRHYYKKFKK